MSLDNAQDGDLIRSYTKNGVEYEVREQNGSYFAVFPNKDTVVVSEGQETVEDAATAGVQIAYLIS